MERVVAKRGNEQDREKRGEAGMGEEAQGAEKHRGYDHRDGEPEATGALFIGAHADVGTAQSDGPGGQRGRQTEYPGLHSQVAYDPDGQVQRDGELDGGVAEIVGIPGPARAAGRHFSLLSGGM